MAIAKCTVKERYHFDNLRPNRPADLLSQVSMRAALSGPNWASKWASIPSKHLTQAVAVTARLLEVQLTQAWLVCTHRHVGDKTALLMQSLNGVA